MCPVDVATEMDIGADLVVAEGLRHHQGTEVRAADADIHHVGDLLPRIAGPLAADHLPGEFLHVLQDGIDLRHHLEQPDLHKTVKKFDAA